MAGRKRVPVALAVLDDILANPNVVVTAKLSAVVQLLERSFGKAPVIEEPAPNRAFRDMSSEELLAITTADLESRGVDVDAVLAKARNDGSTH